MPIDGIVLVNSLFSVPLKMIFAMAMNMAPLNVWQNTMVAVAMPTNRAGVLAWIAMSAICMPSPHPARTKTSHPTHCAVGVKGSSVASRPLPMVTMTAEATAKGG